MAGLFVSIIVMFYLSRRIKIKMPDLHLFLMKNHVWIYLILFIPAINKLINQAYHAQGKGMPSFGLFFFALSFYFIYYCYTFRKRGFWGGTLDGFICLSGMAIITFFSYFIQVKSID